MEPILRKKCEYLWCTPPQLRINSPTLDHQWNQQCTNDAVICSIFRNDRTNNHKNIHIPKNIWSNRCQTFSVPINGMKAPPSLPNGTAQHLKGNYLYSSSSDSDGTALFCPLRRDKYKAIPQSRAARQRTCPNPNLEAYGRESFQPLKQCDTSILNSTFRLSVGMEEKM